MFQVISPIDGSVYIEREYATTKSINLALSMAQQAFQLWKESTITERASLCHRMLDALENESTTIAEETTRQMGRPIQQTTAEIAQSISIARYLIDLADEALKEIPAGYTDELTRFVRHDPLGVVLVASSWAEPFLSAIQTIIPALMAGNTVIVRPSLQTPLSAERLFDAFRAANFPQGVFQCLHLSVDSCAYLISDDRLRFVAYNGAVDDGLALRQATANRFVGSAFLINGCDSAYVREDAEITTAVPALVRGAFDNAGQSSASIKRIYVDTAIYDSFLEHFVAATQPYIPTNPLQSDSLMGPVVNAEIAQKFIAIIQEQLAQGAQDLLNASSTTNHAHSTYLSPTILTHADALSPQQSLPCQGPVVSITRVATEQEAIQKMNASHYGLTASVWTADETTAIRIGAQVEAGTFYMNRCAELDPALAWSGVKSSGYGISLSVLGYYQLTQTKSFYLHTP